MSVLENDKSDIVWLDTSLPIIATIYYNLYLNKKYILYCPDNNDNSTEQHTRDLVRELLKVVDQNSHKKLALYFLKPISTTKREDFLRFIHKRRPNLNISYLTLPYSSIQQSYLSGWVYTLDEHDYDVWFKQNLITLPQVSSPPKTITSSNVYVDHELTQPFLITASGFIKKAFIVDVTSDMVQITENTIEFNSTAMDVINGWIDAAISLPSEQGSTLILIGHEYSFFTDNENEIMQKANLEQSKQLLERKRKMIWAWVESLATSFPIYLFLHGYHKSIKQPLCNTLAWIQHRHHLCISKSILLTWRAYIFDSSCPTFLTQLYCMDLISTAKFNRNKWKKDFIIILNEIESKPISEEQLKILPSKLNVITSENWKTPLMSLKLPFTQTNLEYNDFFIHSVSSLKEEIALNWINKVHGNWEQYIKINGCDIVVDNAVTEDEKCLKNLESISSTINHDIIRNYIANSGAYTRGEKLLHTLDCLSYYWEEGGNLLIFTKSQGTSNDPYNVYVYINKHIASDQVIKGGYCSCPVGKNGRCKHCTALLLRFIINIEEFNQSKEPIVMPYVENVKDKSATTSTLCKSKDVTLDSTTSILANHGTDTHPLASQSKFNSDKNTTQTEKRRILPWVLGKQKKEKENEEKEDTDQPCHKKQKINTKKLRKKSKSTEISITTSNTSTHSENDSNSVPANQPKHKNKSIDQTKESYKSNNSESDDDIQFNPLKPRRLQRKEVSEKKINNNNNTVSSSPSSTDYKMIESGSSSSSKHFIDDNKSLPSISFLPLNTFEEEKEKKEKGDNDTLVQDTSKYRGSDISYSFLSMDDTSTPLSDPVIQGSTVSLPLTDLALSHKSQADNGSDTEDEEYEKLLLEEQEGSIFQRNNDSVIGADNGDDMLRISTSDIFDELGL
ncbi:hypothetical protein BJ944DRAFT_248238 [Cunninghamella echinulata]|nr:hypothetical protein BJ944DRAFT_248238 [Cunninghamella echinulata]